MWTPAKLFSLLSCNFTFQMYPFNHFTIPKNSTTAWFQTVVSSKPLKYYRPFQNLSSTHACHICSICNVPILKHTQPPSYVWYKINEKKKYNQIKLYHHHASLFPKEEASSKTTSPSAITTENSNWTNEAHPKSIPYI